MNTKTKQKSNVKEQRHRRRVKDMKTINFV